MGNIKLWVKRNSPTILMVSAIINEAAAIALACMATKRLPTVIKPVSKKVVKLHNDIEKKPEQEKEIRKELVKLYLKTGSKIALMYAPAVISFSLSTASVIGSHNILKGRNAALAAAFTTLKGGYDAYRQRVRDKLGDEEEAEIYSGKTVETVKDETGKTVTKTVSTTNVDTNDYAFDVLFADGTTCEYDHTHPGLNMTKILEAESMLNRRLEHKGYVFLNEVYEELGMRESYLGKKRLQASRVLGWKFDRKQGAGNSYISFGLRDKDGSLTKEAMAFQNGYEDGVWIKLNPDGDILTGDDGEEPFMDVAIKKGM